MILKGRERIDRRHTYRISISKYLQLPVLGHTDVRSRNPVQADMGE